MLMIYKFNTFVVMPLHFFGLIGAYRVEKWDVVMTVIISCGWHILIAIILEISLYLKRINK